jgi:hypothetical protein
MSSFVSTDPVNAALRDYLRHISKDVAKQLCAAQREARRVCNAVISTLAIESPQERKRVRDLYHTAKTDILLKVFVDGFTTVQELVRAVLDQFKLLLSTTQLRLSAEPVRPRSQEILGLC